MSRGQEIELKLEVGDGGAGLLRKHPLLRGREACAQQQVSTYFDTDDCTLKNAGFSLRLRQTDDRVIQTIKQQQQNGSAGLFARPEWEQPLDAPEVDLAAVEETPLAEILTKKVRKRLAPLIKADMQRTVWSIMRDDAQVELTLDEGVITGGKNSEPLAELEIELKAGDPTSLIDVARELVGQVPLRLGVLTKAERGYALANGAHGRAAKAEKISLDRSMTAAAGFAAIAGACLRHYRLNEPLVVQNRNPAALHQSRVAMRRLRSAFTLFRPVIADAEYERLREEVRWFTNQLGDARNLDVLLKRFCDDDQGAAHALCKRLEAARGRAYADVLKALESTRLRRLMLDLVGWIETGAWRGGEAAAQPLTSFAAGRLDQRWRRVKKGGRDLARLEAEPRHRLRIEVKKLRYAVEFLSSLQAAKDRGADQKEFLEALEEIQEHLGELNDAETARELLGRLLGRGRKSAELIRFAEERLARSGSEEKQLAAADRAYRRLRDVGPFWR